MNRTLKGITWNHTRGLLPMQATAQRYTELHPEMEISWEKRSLKAFEDFPLHHLAEEYDLLVIDHPFVGYAAEHETLVRLDEHLPKEFLADQAENSVGASFASYTFRSHQWALPIDAATPVAMWRPDRFASDGRRVPQSWEQVLELAKEGLVEVPAAPINCLMNFYMFCLALGEEPFLSSERVVSLETGVAALREMKKLIDFCEPECLARNPIQSCEVLASDSRAVYCPFAYGYSNYARAGYAPHLLAFGEPPEFAGQPMRSTLGGTGLAISARSAQREACLDYAMFVAGGERQRTIFTSSGGQPGHRSAWLDEENNRLTHGYFRDTLPALDRAYLRPRYWGCLEFQDQGGPIVHEYFRGRAQERETLGRLNLLYQSSLLHT